MSLSFQEQQMLELHGNGYTAQEIAAMLELEDETVALFLASNSKRASIRSDVKDIFKANGDAIKVVIMDIIENPDTDAPTRFRAAKYVNDINEGYVKEMPTGIVPNGTTVEQINVIVQRGQLAYKEAMKSININGNNIPSIPVTTNTQDESNPQQKEIYDQERTEPSRRPRKPIDDSIHGDKPKDDIKVLSSSKKHEDM